MVHPIIIRIIEILLVPYYHKELVWTIAPLILGLLMLQMYFGKYKTEELGWNTAFGNTISLMWVTVIIARYLHEQYGIVEAWKAADHRGYVVMIGVLALLTLALAVMNFQHKLPKKFAFLISSSLPINLLAYFTIVFVIGRIVLDSTTFWASVIIFLVLAIIFKLYKVSITPPKSELPTLQRRQERREEKVKEIKRKIKKAINKAVIQPIEKIEEPMKKLAKKKKHKKESTIKNK